VTADDLRYPTGRLRLVDDLSPEARGMLIEKIRTAPAALREAVRGLTDAQLETPYRPGGWTVRQVVHHVPDSHMNGYTRFKLALTEDNPTLKTYDEDAWSKLADVRGTPIETSLRLLELLHERWVALLEATPDAAVARPCRHPDDGPLTADTILQIYAWHGHHHARHVTALRAREGWR
jgi:uncharacterized damage-inducible protein DinB